MYEIVKSVLNQGGYNLTDIIKKTDLLWAQGKLTDAEYEELTAMARNRAKAENSVDVLAKLEEFDKRLAALESREASTDNAESSVAEYVTGKWYYSGDKCLFDGKTYICIAPEGTACVWSPVDYPAYWEEFV